MCVPRNVIALGVCFLSLHSLVFAQGLQLPGIGPVNRSMGGAAVAAPLEPIGALHWNPATISGLSSNELSVGVELLTPTGHLKSTVNADALGAGFPATTLTGSDSSDSGWLALPSIGLVYRPEGSAITFGFGTYGIAGYGVNYGASATNPISFPQTPTASTPFPGFGRIHADVQLMQITAVASMQINPRLSVAIGPTIMLAKLAANPFPFAAPDDENMDGFETYPDGDGTKFHWGGGFEAGVFYQAENCWNFGASLKSKNWFETFHYRSQDELGLPRSLAIDFEYPMILSLGAAYTGFEKLVFASDVRWTDYANTETLGEGPEFDPVNNRLHGLGWESVWSVAVGMQYLFSETLSIRTGYSYAESPITNETAGVNVAAPVVLRHSLNAGATYKIGSSLQLHLAYHHIFPSRVSGMLHSVAGPIPETNVNYAIGAHGISAGISTTF